MQTGVSVWVEAERLARGVARLAVQPVVKVALDGREGERVRVVRRVLLAKGRVAPWPRGLRIRFVWPESVAINVPWLSWRKTKLLNKPAHFSTVPINPTLEADFLFQEQGVASHVHFPALPRCSPQ